MSRMKVSWKLWGVLAVGLSLLAAWPSTACAQGYGAQMEAGNRMRARAQEWEGGRRQGYGDQEYEYEEDYSEEYEDEYGEYDEDYGEGYGPDQRERPVAIEVVETEIKLPAPKSAEAAKPFKLGQFEIETRTRTIRYQVEVDESEMESEEGYEDEYEEDYEEEYDDEDYNEDYYDEYEEEYEDEYEDEYGDGYDSGPRMKTVTEEVTENIPWKLTLLYPGGERFQKRRLARDRGGDGYGEDYYEEGYEDEDYYEEEYPEDYPEEEYYEEEYETNFQEEEYYEEEDYYDEESDEDDYYDEEDGYYEDGYDSGDAQPEEKPEDLGVSYSPVYSLQASAMADGKTEWKLLLKYKEQWYDIAHIRYNDAGGLYIKWEPIATAAAIEPLRWHVLVLETGENAYPMSFPKVDEVEGVLLDCSTDEAASQLLTLPGLPSDATVCLEVTGLAGFKAVSTSPKGAVPMNTAQLVAINRQPDDELLAPSAPLLQAMLTRNDKNQLAIRTQIAPGLLGVFSNYRRQNLVTDEKLLQMRANMKRRIQEREDRLPTIAEGAQGKVREEIRDYQTKIASINVIFMLKRKRSLSYRIYADAGGYAVPVAEYVAPDSITKPTDVRATYTPP